jgi:hypothetical protein
MFGNNISGIKSFSSIAAANMGSGSSSHCHQSTDLLGRQTSKDKCIPLRYGGMKS